MLLNLFGQLYRVCHRCMLEHLSTNTEYSLLVKRVFSVQPNLCFYIVLQLESPLSFFFYQQLA